MERDRHPSRVGDDTEVLAHALARVDPDALIRACRVRDEDDDVHRDDDVHENESTVATSGGGAPALNKTEQERLARALNASMKYSKAYASMTARRAVKAIEREGGVLEDALAETLTACATSGIGLDDKDAKANASSSLAMCDDDGGWWCVKAFMYDVDNNNPHQRVGCVEHRETREEYALGVTDADCVAARTRRDALAGSTGAFAWSAGFVAGEIVMNYGDVLVRGKRCVELGSGTGVTGTVLARSRPRALTLTDRDETTLANLCETLRVNREMDGEECCGFDVVRCETLADAVRDETTTTTTRTRVCPLDWERASASEMAALNADFILAADCAYDPTLIPGLVRALRGTLGVLTDDDCTDNDAKPTPLKTLDAPSAERALQTEYSTRPFALVLSAVRQPETMDTLISSLENARLHPVDVTSAIDAMRADPSARGFLFARAARSHAHDAIRAFACSASSSA